MPKPLAALASFLLLAAAAQAQGIHVLRTLKVGGDREKLRAALDTGKWNGIMGEVQFVDYSGYTNQNHHQMLVEQIQDGKHETVWPPQYAVKKPHYPFKWK